ncbi:uncharacterized protein N7496_007540 [Penicillium cataractarum]|uniref:F-box domain-containing protein n=1 Tax=Penicillium cataractarum TaxID=2100454 RepID=A0A9W9S3M5_9EURO|nr:uncharacterized protein N7496_007540 [Penicillium cataractarum]KAJ5371448.1 hypothetical protein N7496_007540 [Penicillium cataractarum]
MASQVPQASGAGSPARGNVPWVVGVPLEILSMILSSLTNRDRKSLRLTCKVFRDIIPLCLSRVFVSANPLDIEVFRAVADHPKFRHQVTEIIWDDARFIAAPPLSEDEWYAMIDDGIQTLTPRSPEIDPENHPPSWFLRECEDNIQFIAHRKSWDRDHPYHVARQKQVDAQMPPEESLKYYQKLLRQQNEVLVSRSDEKAFVYGIDRFSALRRVVVTPAAHGWLFSPLYGTPTIRSLPYGFNYPIPRGWPTVGLWEVAQYPLPWSEAPEEYKEQWHGTRIVLRILAHSNHNVSELSFDAMSLITAINFMMLEQPCEEYDHFMTILKRPKFSHLDLPLYVGGTGTYLWARESSGNLRRALSKARDLQHVSFSTTLDPGPRGPPIPLTSVFPVEDWPTLRHFGLFRFDVSQTDLLGLLKLLPKTLQSVELGFLDMSRDGGRWSDLLEAIRAELPWSNDTHRPRVRIIMQGYERIIGRGLWLEHEVDRFLYESGENPAHERDSNKPQYGMGEARDLFEPEFTRPHLGPRELDELGIIQWGRSQ